MKRRNYTLSRVTARFLHIVLPTLAGLLAVQAMLFSTAEPAVQALQAPLLQLRIECILHCLAVAIGGALLMEIAVRDRRRAEK